MVVTVAVTFISVVSGVLWCFPVLRVCVAVWGLVRGQRLLLLFDARAITCGRSFTVLGVWVDLISFRSVLVFSSAFFRRFFPGNRLPEFLCVS